MYNLYLDKQETFRYSIKISGASQGQAQLRLALETDTYNLYFTGKIINNEAIVVIKPLQSFFEEDITGIMKLEVILDNTYITPWVSEFKTTKAIKVTTSNHMSELRTPDVPMIELDNVKIAELRKKFNALL